MALISSGQVTVGTTATLVDGTSTSDFRLTIHNMNNDDGIYIGGPNVTIATGMQLLKLETLQLDMSPMTELYAVADKANLKLGFLKQV
jgi:hypothetical protein